MKAVVYSEFKGRLRIQDVPEPATPANGVLIQVKATGLCRSDWHGWQGHDADISLPHVPGHEFSGIVSNVGAKVTKWKSGDRVTVPFVCGCGSCPQCATGNQQICDNQSQPGFTHWGSFSEFVSVYHADENLVKLPDDMSFGAAATLGCRYITSYRALVDQGKVKSEDWVAIHGVGGIGLSAIQIAKAKGAYVIATDIVQEKLEFAKDLGADYVLNAETSDTGKEIQTICGGAHISMDALGSIETCKQSIASLRKHGKHIQVGLMAGKDENPTIAMDKVIAYELQLIGSHGMQAHRYPEIFEMILEGKLHPEYLVKSKISLEDIPQRLSKIDDGQYIGITVALL